LAEAAAKKKKIKKEMEKTKLFYGCGPKIREKCYTILEMKSEIK